MEVPEVLLSGHHANIEKWRRYEALKRTWQKRPELLEQAELSKEDIKLLDKIKKECK
jgi:tRNA (guanine37-N1)-methyltransferase